MRPWAVCESFLCENTCLQHNVALSGQGGVKHKSQSLFVIPLEQNVRKKCINLKMSSIYKLSSLKNNSKQISIETQGCAHQYLWMTTALERLHFVLNLLTNEYFPQKVGHAIYFQSYQVGTFSVIPIKTYW